ncbi:MAG: heparan-alpha-glucosaminide N-acetyltransferase [Pseudomonadota bacterium]
MLQPPLGEVWAMVAGVQAERAAGAPARIDALDVARGVALLAMAVFHLAFDLQMFGLIAPGTLSRGLWPEFARLVAASFLFLAGVSLWLAHGSGIRWRAYLRRFAILVSAAALVSGATYVAFPQAFIYFGILHSIAAASLIGLALLRAPVWALLALAALVVAAPDYLRSEALNHPALWWTGLATAPRASVDYEPVLPWAAPFLCGLAVAKIADAQGLWARLAARPFGPAALVWAGRHSLAVYLLHQPFLIACVWVAAQVFG